MEDDMGMIDGILNNGPKQEVEKRISIKDILRRPAEKSDKSLTQKKNKEMEI